VNGLAVIDVLARFTGKSGSRLLCDALAEQFVAEHSAEIARALCRVAKVSELLQGAQLISQEAADNDIHFILSGAVDVLIKRRKIATRGSGLHVGEMAMIDPHCRRSATVVANQDTVVATVAEPAFAKIAQKHPSMWRRLALELANRLRERSKFICEPNPCPVVFIGSSSEARAVVEALRRSLASPGLRVQTWTKGVFRASRTTIEDLEEQAQKADFAVLVASPDDMTRSRGKAMAAPRDNVLLELGLFMGALTRGRTFLLWPEGANLKLPSDFLGVTTLRYTTGRSGRAVVTEACREIRARISAAGPR
jgi:predicted nucleotide-binding protein